MLLGQAPSPTEQRGIRGVKVVVSLEALSADFPPSAAIRRTRFVYSIPGRIGMF